MCKVAVIGYGVVGSGTVELFMKNRESISKKVGKECDIKYILDLWISLILHLQTK